MKSFGERGAGVWGRVAPPPFFLSRLLFSEVCLLAAVAGIMAWRWPGPGLLLFCLVVLLDRPRARGFAFCGAHALFLVLSFVSAFGYAAFREPAPVPVPGWLAKAAEESVHPYEAAGELAEEGRRGPAGVPVLARVESCTPLPGGRLRVVLKDMARRDGPEGADPDVYRGRAVWTWNGYDAAAPGILSGQNLAMTLRFAPVRGFENPGTWNMAEYWRDRGVFHRAWGGKSDLPCAWSGERWWMKGEGTDGWLDRAGVRAAEKRRNLQTGFMAALPRGWEASAILPALVFGDRSLLSPEQVDFFARSTLAHSLALSGLHLGFAVLGGFWLALGAGYLRPKVWEHISRPRLALVFALPLAALYLWLGQAPVSLQRAACMLAFWTLLIFLRRPKVLLDGLFAALACILLFNPLALYELGLQLSVLSVAAIALCLPGIMKLAGRLFRKPLEGRRAGRPATWVRSVAKGAFVIAAISFCIQVALLPLTVEAFGSTGLLFPLNIIWLPVLGVLVLPLAFLGLFAVSLGLPGVAGALLSLAALPCEALLLLLRRLDGAGLLLAPLMPRPHWLFWAGFWMLCLAVPLLATHGLRLLMKSRDEPARPLNRPALLTALAGCLCMLLPLGAVYMENSRTAVRLILLDVGQGQSVLLEWSGLGSGSGKGRALIDGGGFAPGSFDVGKAVVAPVLTRSALPRLDMVINSHPDTDHLGGLLFILEAFRVGRYLGNGDAASPDLYGREQKILRQRGIAMERLAAGDIVSLGPELHLEVLWPPAGQQTARAGAEKRNNASLVLRLVWQGRGLAVICGDAGKPVLRELAVREPGALAAEVLVLPHHGSAGSLVPGFYRAVNPAMALAACGFANRWGYPSRAVQETLRKLRIPLHDTASAGQIRLRWTAPDAGAEAVFTLPRQP